MRRDRAIRGPLANGLHGHLDTIERITGARPASCPWRALYDPLVREVQRLAWAIDSGNLAAVIDKHTPAAVVDALGHFRAAQQAVFAEERRIRDAEREAQRAADRAKG